MATKDAYIRYWESQGISLADLEPVVRCKDCKHWAMHSWCSRLAPFDKVYMSADDFCSKGVRREVEE